MCVAQSQRSSASLIMVRSSVKPRLHRLQAQHVARQHVTLPVTCCFKQDVAGNKQHVAGQHVARCERGLTPRLTWRVNRASEFRRNT